MLKLFEAFAGIGSQSMALRNLGIPYINIGISEIDKYAVQSYELIHGKVKNYGDISKIDWNTVPDFDLFTYSFPCFIAGTLVLTDNGYKKIEDIQTGDCVLTHKNRFEKVVNLMINKTNHLIKINCMASEDLFTTKEHPFFVRKKYKEWDNSIGQYVRKFKSPEWINASKLTNDYYVGMSVNNKEEIPDWCGIEKEWSDGRKSRTYNKIKDCFSNEYFWWFVGRYIADGWYKENVSGNNVVLGIGKSKKEETIKFLDKTGFKYGITEEKTVFKFIICSNELVEFLKQFGKYSYGKFIPNFILNLPVDLLKFFFDGYMSGDGCFTHNLYKATTVSKKLVYGLGQCVAKIYKRPFGIYKTKRPKTTIIENRTVNQRNTYSINFKTTKNKQDKAFYEDGYIWFPINKIEYKKYNGLVYNMEVNEDNSYTVNNIIVHNCQDVSLAGKRQGLDKSSNTRSSLLWECERCIKHKHPKYLLLENVKGLITQEFKPYFLKWLQLLQTYGYTNYWQVLSTKDFGIPQNRERVFAISIRNDIQQNRKVLYSDLFNNYTYDFPKKFDNGLRIKHLLQDNVDDKYYLSNNTLEKIKKWNSFKNPLIHNLYSNDKLEIINCITARGDGVLHSDMKLIKESFNENKFVNGGVCAYDYSKKFEQEQRIWSENGNSPTITSQHNNNLKIAIQHNDNYLIRKLTPLECWRLMAFSDNDFFKVKPHISNSQLYKQAGNSISVNVLEFIFYHLFTNIYIISRNPYNYYKILLKRDLK